MSRPPKKETKARRARRGRRARRSKLIELLDAINSDDSDFSDNMEGALDEEIEYSKKKQLDADERLLNDSSITTTREAVWSDDSGDEVLDKLKV